MIKTGLIGFGLSGKVFHAPFLNHLDLFDFQYCVTSRIHELKNIYPNVHGVECIDELINKDIDLVVITSPNYLHFDHAKKSLEAGKDIVMEKPFVTNLDEAYALRDIADKLDRQIFIFHNRRYDGDFLAINKIISDNTIGEIHFLESHFDRFTQSSPLGWRGDEEKVGSGVLFDLGPHLIDQAIALFGKPQNFFGKKKYHSQSSVDEGFYVFLDYGKCEVHLHAHTKALKNDRRFLIHGSSGSYEKFGLDTQESFLKESNHVLNIPRNTDGKIYLDGIIQNVKTPKGAYVNFYKDVYRSLIGKDVFPIKLDEAIEGLRIISSLNE